MKYQYVLINTRYFLGIVLNNDLQGKSGRIPTIGIRFMGYDSIYDVLSQIKMF